MDCVGDLLPAVDLVFGPDSGAVGDAAFQCGDLGCFGDEQGSWCGGSLFVVGFCYWEGDVGC